MRRVLTSLLVALLLAGGCPLTVLAATMASTVSATTRRGHAGHGHAGRAGQDQSAVPITLFTTGAAAHGAIGAAGPITCDTGGANKCHADVLYTPAANYNGSDSFSFTATGPDGPDTATASITITAVNDAPVCAGDAQLGQRGHRPDRHGRLHRRREQPADLQQGRGPGPRHRDRQRPTADGATRPTANYNGADSFTFRANDGTAELGHRHDVPHDPGRSTTRPCAATRPAPATRTSSRRAPSPAATSTTPASRSPRSSDPGHGSASVATDGGWTYTPTNNYSGSDSVHVPRQRRHRPTRTPPTCSSRSTPRTRRPCAPPTPARAPRTRTSRAP